MSNPWPNRITLIRCALNLSLFLFLFFPSSWVILAAFLYTLSLILDVVDGRLARRTGSVTALGARLDTEADAFGVLGASLLGVIHGKLPAWFLLAGLARYLQEGALWARRRLGRPVQPPPPRKSRRRLAGLAMGFLAAALYPAVPASMTQFAAYLIGIPFLAGFVRDWFFAAGWMNRQP